MKDKKAFTLVELLVAMAVIAVLITLSVFGIATVQQSARDTQRRSALRDIEVSLNALLTSGATGFSAGTYATGSMVINGTGASSQTITLTGPAQRIATDVTAGAVGVAGNTSAATTDYCAGFSGLSYVVGSLLESGSYTYVNNSGSVYPSTWSLSVSPTTGSGPACADSTL